jgi:hypothetical protein
MKFIGWVLALLSALLLAPSTLAATLNVAGVKLDDTVELQGHKLRLNGAGVRYKFVVKVYAAGLYLAHPAHTPEEALAAPGAKRISITMLRDIDANELGKLFTRGVEDNTPRGNLSKLIPGLLRMGQLFSDHKKLSTGDNFLIDWVPGTGTVITIQGKVQEPFKEPEFFNALLSIWLGKSPADWQLRDALLGNEKAR